MSESQVTTRIFTVANIVTFVRMGLIPVFAVLLAYHHPFYALVVFSVAGVSDGIDGFIARKFKQETELGTIIDPIADKLLMITAFVMLTIPGVLEPGRHLPVPFWVTAAVIGRDVLIITVAASIMIMTGFKGFKPSWPGKASTFVQVAAVMLILIAAVLPALNGFYLPTVYTTVVAFAVFSGIHYIFFVSRLMGEAEQS